MPQQLNRDWLSKQEAADYLGCTTVTLMKYVKAGKLTATRIFNSGSSPVRISASSIEKMMEKSRHQVAPASPRKEGTHK